MQESETHLSQTAKLVLASLRAHPDYNTPELIADGPYSIDQIDIPKVTEALYELEAAGRAVQSLGGGVWTRVGD